jgi:hypothetical protein
MKDYKYAAVFLTAINQEALASRNENTDKNSMELNLSTHGSSQINLIVKNRNELLNTENTKPIEFIDLNAPTKGALISLSFTLDKIPDGMPILVIPTNSWVDFDSNQFVIEMINSENTIGVVCFESNNPNFSYLRKRGNQVLEFKEKEVIGDLATAGIFYFANKLAISKCIEWCLLNNINKNEIYYLAPSLNYFVCQDSKIGIYEIEASKYYRINSESDIDTIKKVFKNANI